MLNVFISKQLEKLKMYHNPKHFVKSNKTY